MSGKSLNPTSRFTGCADAYAKYRPTYPREAIDATVRGAPSASGLRIVDVGAGTGISSRLYAARGCVVVAVEPNAEMRMGGARHDDGLEARPTTEEKDTGQRPVPPRIKWVDGTAERTGLPDACADLVVCAQAFHWFRPAEALSEFARILDARSPLRRVALIWNELDDADGATRGYREHMRRHAVESPQSPWNTPPGEPLMKPEARAAGFAHPRIERYPSFQELDEEGLVGRARSASYMPRDAERWAAAERELRELWREFEEGGVFRLRYQTEVHLAEKREA